MNISKIKAVWKLTTGGVAGLIEYLLDLFNDQVLAKVKDKEEFAAYAEDVAQFVFFLDGVMNRHTKWMSDAKRAAFSATINAVKELADALKDCKFEASELDAVIEKIKAAIEAWKAAK